AIHDQGRRTDRRGDRRRGCARHHARAADGGRDRGRTGRRRGDRRRRRPAAGAKRPAARPHRQAPLAGGGLPPQREAGGVEGTSRVIAFLALFRDAWRRARDRRGVMILVLLGLLVAFFCATIEFGAVDPAKSLAEQLRFSDVRQRRGPRSFMNLVTMNRPPKVETRLATPEDDLPLG